MENEILDFENEENHDLNYRTKLLIIESLTVLIMIITANISRIPGFEILRLLLLPLIIFAFLFLLFSPPLRYRQKESSGKVAFLYWFQNVFLLVFIFGLVLKIESWPFATETIMLGGVSLIFLFWLPHLQLKKSDSPRQLHILTAFINLAFLISFIGIFLKLDSRASGTEIIYFGGHASLILLIIISFSYFSNRKKFAPILFYVPRLLLVLYYASFLIFNTSIYY